MRLKEIWKMFNCRDYKDINKDNSADFTEVTEKEQENVTKKGDTDDQFATALLRKYREREMQCNILNFNDRSNLIDKMAVMYEIIYPDEAFSNDDDQFSSDEYVNRTMFRENSYLNSKIDDFSVISSLNWNDFFSVELMIKLLSPEEREYLKKPRYDNYITLTDRNYYGYVELSNKGTITKSNICSSLIKSKDLCGLQIEEAIELLKNKKVAPQTYSKLEEEVLRVKKLNSERELLLDGVMFKILERDSSYMGTRRALLFANEFKRDLNVPLVHKIFKTSYDESSEAFIEKYIEFGGDPELVRKLITSPESNYIYDKEELDEILKPREVKQKEQELRQRLVTSLYGSINQEELAQEKVKQLRIERKLNKSKKN